MVKITRGDITTYTFNVEVPEELVDSVKRKKAFKQWIEVHLGMNSKAEWSTMFPTRLQLTIATGWNEQEITEKVNAFVTGEYNRTMKTPLAQL
jgi:hypothetical protein